MAECLQQDKQSVVNRRQQLMSERALGGFFITPAGSLVDRNSRIMYY